MLTDRIHSAPETWGAKGGKTPSAWREPRRVNRLTLGVYNEAPTKAGEDIANPSIKLQSEY